MKSSDGDSALCLQSLADSWRIGVDWNPDLEQSKNNFLQRPAPPPVARSKEGKVLLNVSLATLLLNVMVPPILPRMEEEWHVRENPSQDGSCVRALACARKSCFHSERLVHDPCLSSESSPSIILFVWERPKPTRSSMRPSWYLLRSFLPYSQDFQLFFSHLFAER